MTNLIKHFIASLKFEIKEIVFYWKSLLPSFCFWNWRFISLSSKSGSYQSALYIGRHHQVNEAKIILGIHDDQTISNGQYEIVSRAVISEVPLPGALHVPTYLSTILPLDRPIDELIKNIGKDKLKLYREYRQFYRVRPIKDDIEIAHINETMLKAYAIKRYGESAAHLDLSDVKRMAQSTGVFNLVYLNDKPVGCYIGHEYIHRGKRCWRASRAGFPVEIFDDGKLLGDINAMVYFLELEWVSQQGFASYDIGISRAQPDNEVLQYKRRLRGHLSTLGVYEYFYLYPPKDRKWDFFWDNPLLGVEQNKPVLYIGKPNNITDEDFMKRMRQMKFDGLSKLYLHAKQAPSARLLSELANLFAQVKMPPQLIPISYERESSKTISSKTNLQFGKVLLWFLLGNCVSFLLVTADLIS